MYTANLPWNFGVMDWLPASAPDSIACSLADASVRPVGVRISLEDPRGRTPYIWARLPDRTEYHVKDEGHVVDMWFLDDPEKKFISGILLGTFAPATKDAFKRCMTLALTTMSVWSFQLQRPVAVRDIRIEDKTNSAVWIVHPQSQVPIQLEPMDVSLAAPNAIGSLLALFREGMASVQPVYRFLCYFKIIEAWKKHEGPFKNTDDLLSARGRRRDMSSLVVRAEMFERKWSQDNYAELIGRKFTALIDEMDDARNFLAHPFRYSGEFVSFDDPATMAHFADLANIAERIAIEVLVEEIKLISSMDESGMTQRVARCFTHRSWAPEFFAGQ